MVIDYSFLRDFAKTKTQENTLEAVIAHGGNHLFQNNLEFLILNILRSNS